MREYKFRAAVRASIGKRPLASNRWLALAVAATPLLFATAAFAESSVVTSVGPVPIRDLTLAGVVVAIQIALFISIPIYLHARRRKSIRSRIRILYDSRLDKRSRPSYLAGGIRTASGRLIAFPIVMHLRAGGSDELHKYRTISQ